MRPIDMRPSASISARAAKSRWPRILLIVGAGILSAFQVGKAPMALSAVQSDLQVSLDVASWLLSAFAIVGSIAGIGIGSCADRIAAKRTVVVGLLLQAGGGAAGAMSPDIVLLLLTRVVEGIGFLAVVVAAPALISTLAQGTDQPRAFAVWSTFMPAGMMLVMLGAPLLSATGWRGYWLINAALLAGYVPLLAAGLRGPSPAGPATRSVPADIRQTLAAKGPWVLAALFSLFSAGYFALFGFLPTILADRFNFGEETANTLTAIAVVASAFGNLACGPLLAHGMDARRILFVTFCTMALCSFGALNDGLSWAAAYACCTIFSAASGFIPVVLFQLAPGAAPRPALVATTMGFLMQGNNVGLVLGPVAAASLVTMFGWFSVSGLIAAIALAAGTLSLSLPALRKPARHRKF